jgi:arsenate reductase (thioredoxin)
VEWNIEDPKRKSIEKVREIRDGIEQRVRQLATDLLVKIEDLFNYNR